MTILRKPLSRRTVLRGAGGAVIALPFLDAMRPLRRAHAAPVTKRFVAMFSPNGTIAPNWNPTRGPSGADTDFTLSPILDPLTPYQSSIVVIEGLDQQGGGGDGHQNGIGGMLTGQMLNPGPFQGGAGAPPAGWASGISVDQRIANVVGAGTPLRSLELGVQVQTADNWSRMSYLGNDQPVPPESDPAQAYARLFSDFHTDPAVLAQQRARRKSVLDAVSDQFTAVLGQLGGEDKMKVDAHFSAIRQIESRLDTTGVAGAGCVDPMTPTLDATTLNENDNYPMVGALQMDLLVMALACGMTRVASLQWSRSVSQVRFTWLGISDGHHDLSHLGDDDAVAVDKLTRINNWYAQQYATLIAKMKAIPDGDGTLLDNTLMLWSNELAKGNTHSRIDAPYVLAGGAGGALATGRFLSYAGMIPHNNMLVSILNAMDIPDTTFGKPDWCTGALTGLL
jgi:hypothetical protein